MKDQVIAILCSDLHLSEKPPAARVTDNWFGVMKEYFAQLYALAAQHQAIIVAAGDIFDKWNPSPALLNFAIANMPPMYAIPGQHDLPNHRLEDIQRTGFWNLVEAKKITHIYPNMPRDIPGLNLCLYGFPWGVPITPTENCNKCPLKLAVVHSYIWYKGCKYHGIGAGKDTYVESFLKSLKGYDAAVFGDNHLSFTYSTDEFNLINPGTFMRRKSDEIAYKPQVGLLHASGKIAPHFLDTSKDRFIDVERARVLEGSGLDAKEFLEELKTLSDSAINFGETLRRAITNENEEVREIILRAMGK